MAGYNDDGSVGQSSYAVAMANDAIDNARRAAASSRSRRANASASDFSHHSSGNHSTGQYDAPKPLPSSTPQMPRANPIPGTAEFVRNEVPREPNSIAGKIARNSMDGKRDGGDNMDLKNNDNAYHVVATLIVDRLLPKLSTATATQSITHFSLTPDDVAFFQQMLPQSVRTSFVDALRYRLQLIKSGVGSVNSPLGRLNMQCQLLGLERVGRGNALLMLDAGFNYPINFKSQGPLAFAPGQQDFSNYEPSQQYGTTQASNGITFGLSSPMATFSPTNNDTNNNNHFMFNGLDPNQASISNEHDNNNIAAESLARQQIMAEINETKFLMRGSVTPEAVSFWKKHLEDLSERLVVLSREEQIRVAGGYANGGGNNGGSFGSESMSNYDADMYGKVKKHYGVPNMQSREEYLENNRRMREEAGMVADDQYCGGAPFEEQQQQQGYQPPMPSDHIIDAQVDVVSNTYRPSPFKNNHQEELPVCDVVAPSDLPGGYMFEAQLGQKKFLATVPPGGVTKGQRFVSTMRELETIEIPVPLGAWRDDGCECFAHGICHPLFLNTIFFPCVALGQIMTRTGLDWEGVPSNKLVSGLSCANMSVILTFWMAMNASALFMFRVKWERGMDFGSPYIAGLVLFNVITWIYLMNITKNVRESIRNKYQIPEERCIGCEDCMCATFCTSCTICQMGRHTADFETYRASCCTKTGLPRNVELAQVTFYDDQYVDSQNVV